MTSTFHALGLSQELVQTVTELGYETPTSIQTETIPLLLDGRDVLGQAQTGTGKTAAFALPMLHTLDPACRHVQGLVIAPTRELANQVASAIHGYGNHGDVRVLSIYGGQSYARQISRLKRGVDIVVGTPGRLLDLIKKQVLDLNGVRFLVLDEADEMLSMGFIEDIEAIIDETPPTRQTALFSATLPSSIRHLADRYMQTPKAITVNPRQLTVTNTEQRYYIVQEADKVAATIRLLEMEDVTRALIFTRTRVGAGELADTLVARGFKAEALHGDLSQQARESVLSHFRRGQISLLVATDVAARGLDIEDISHVINYDIPLDPEYYVHRIGRTGRVGKTGIAITLATLKESWRMSRIEKYIRRPITLAQLPTITQVQDHRDERFMNQLADQVAQGKLDRERVLIEKLSESGCDPLDLAAAAIQLARAEEQQRPLEQIATISKSARRKAKTRHTSRRKGTERKGAGRKRRRESGMVRLSMNMGRMHKLHPGEIVGAIAGTAHLPGKAIGAINIYQHKTFVDVAEKHTDHILRKMKGWKLHGQAIVLQLAR